MSESIFSQIGLYDFGLWISLANASQNFQDHCLTPSLPPDYFRIKRVRSFGELAGPAFAKGVNALCWPRTLAGDFGEVVGKLGAGEEIVTIEEDQLLALEVSAAGRAAIEILREDLRRLREAERDPVLNCIYSLPTP